jgi:hypothetical protein
MKGISASANKEEHVSPACIRDIFSQDNNINKLGEHLNIYPGVTYVRNKVKNNNQMTDQKRRGKKTKVITFSDKSRRNMMVTLAKIENPFRFWQDFTFADDVMQGMTIGQRAKYASYSLKKLKQWMEREGLDIHGIWKREWVKRKSGELTNEYIPHFHVVYIIPAMDKEKYLSIAIKIAQEWVRITGTKNEDRALAVALHPKSYRFIESRKQMQKYMSKYLVKDRSMVFTESIGRNWGRIGSPKMDQGDVIEVTEKEMVLFKRCLRKVAKRARGYFREALNQPYTKFFMFIERTTVIRYFEWLRVNYAFDGVPF